MAFQGSCHCGAVKFSADADLPTQAMSCNCSICRRKGVLMAFFPVAKFKLEQGEDAHSFFVLLHGHVRATQTTPAGEQIVVRYVANGETFGVAKAIGLQRYPATATAFDDSVVLAWPSGTWPRLVEKFPALAANCVSATTGRPAYTPYVIKKVSLGKHAPTL